MSDYASVDIIHQGPSMRRGNIKFIGYASKIRQISKVASSYISYIYPDFYRAIKEIASVADVVQVERPYLLLPTIMVAKTLKNKPLIVLDEHNVDFYTIKSKIEGFSFNSFLTIATLPYVFLSENLAIDNSDLILCVSNADKESLVKLYGTPRTKILVIPNGVNLSSFEEASLPTDPILKEKFTIFFHGTLSWYPNLEAANIIIDYLAPRIPEATFLIAGGNPPKSFLKKLNKVNNVKYLGFLQNLEGWIKSSRICIAPILRGGGTKLKILEYAAAGRPLVATFKATQGLEMINGVHGIFHFDVNEVFVDSIRKLMDNESLAKEIGRNNIELARLFDWTVIGKKLYTTYLNSFDLK